jgi:hypothetical protein
VNNDTSREMAARINRLEGLMQQFITLQMSNLRPLSHQSGCKMPIMPQAAEADVSSELSYVEEPELAPTRE